MAQDTITINPTAVNNDVFLTGDSAAVPSAPVSSAVSASAAPEQGKKQPSIYGEIPNIPTQEAVDGIRFDFNHGIRILFPRNDKEYHVTFSDIDTGIVLYSADTVPGAYVTSIKKFFIRFRLVIHEKGGREPIFTHDYDATGKEVMIQLPVGTIGDSIGWFSYVERFQQKHKCKAVCVMTPWIAEIVKGQYPDITFIAPEETGNYRPYACYYMGLFFKGDVDNQPIDFRYIGLHRTAFQYFDHFRFVDLSAAAGIEEKAALRHGFQQCTVNAADIVIAVRQMVADHIGHGKRLGETDGPFRHGGRDADHVEPVILQHFRNPCGYGARAAQKRDSCAERTAAFAAFAPVLPASTRADQLVKILQPQNDGGNRVFRHGDGIGFPRADHMHSAHKQRTRKVVCCAGSVEKNFEVRKICCPFFFGQTAATPGAEQKFHL